MGRVHNSGEMVVENQGKIYITISNNMRIPLNKYGIFSLYADVLKYKSKLHLNNNSDIVITKFPGYCRQA